MGFGKGEKHDGMVRDAAEKNVVSPRREDHRLVRSADAAVVMHAPARVRAVDRLTDAMRKEGFTIVEIVAE